MYWHTLLLRGALPVSAARRRSGVLARRCDPAWTVGPADFLRIFENAGRPGWFPERVGRSATDGRVRWNSGTGWAFLATVQQKGAPMPPLDPANDNCSSSTSTYLNHQPREIWRACHDVLAERGIWKSPCEDRKSTSLNSSH